MNQNKSDDKDAEEQYTVEEVLERRERNGEVQFLVKWKGYPSEDNTWEAEKNLSCTELISKFSKVQDEQDDLNSKADKSKVKVRGFSRGLDAEKIIGVTKVEGEIIYLIKWQGEDEADMVTGREANQKCPQVVIQYLEKHLDLSPNNHKDADPSEN